MKEIAEMMLEQAKRDLAKLERLVKAGDDVSEVDLAWKRGAISALECLLIKWS